MISYLGLLIQFSPATGRAGRCSQIPLCVGSTHRVLATLGLYLYRGVCAFPVYTAQAPCCSIWSGPCVECSSSFRVLHKSADSVAPACCVFPASAVHAARGLPALFPGARAFSLCSEWPRQPDAWVHSPRMRRAFSLRGPSARHQSGQRKSLDRNRGLFAGWEGVASLGLSLPLAPPTASYLQRGWGMQ